MLKGEKMLCDLGYKTLIFKNSVTFMTNDVEIIFDKKFKTMTYEIRSLDEFADHITIVFTYEELRAINQIMIDYGWIKDETLTNATETIGYAEQSGLSSAT